MSDRSLAARIGLVIASLVLAAFLLIGFKSPDELGLAAAAAKAGGNGSVARATVPPTTPGGRNGGGTSGERGAGRGGATGGTGGSGGSTATPAPAAGTASNGNGSLITGQLVQTRFGPVQVQIMLGGGGWVDVKAVQLPAGGRSGAISSYAAPILRSEALSAKSANIQIVSGATYTSRAYETSLQAALDQLHG